MIRSEANLSPKGGLRRIALVAVPPVEELDLVGPLEVFAGVNRLLPGRSTAYAISILSADSGRTIAGASGLSLLSQGNYRQLKSAPDTLIVVGGIASRKKRNPAFLHWLKRMAVRTRRLASVCVGAFFLAEAGLLDDKRATTHWAFAAELKARYPQVRVEPNPIWVQDGAVYTSAGVTAGIDLALAMVEEDHGSALALQVARGLVVFLRRPGNQAQFSLSLAGQTSERRSLRDLQVWMAENLNAALSVEVLAERAAMSARHFSRVFTQEVGVTPAKFVERLRLDKARRALEQSSKSMKEIAAACGFSSSEIMRRTFLSHLEVTPSAYRYRFQTHMLPI